MTAEPRSFHNAAPVVRYEVDASDTLIRVNEAWTSFAVANNASNLLTDGVIGRSLWDFLPHGTTRLVYDILLRQVRDGGQSRFAYRCDSPDRRRFMEMTITAGTNGHVIFESATVRVECHAEYHQATLERPNLDRACGWCKRAHYEEGWREIGATVAKTDDTTTALVPMITSDGMCADCYNRVMHSVVDDPQAVAAAIRQALRPLNLPQPPRPAARPLKPQVSEPQHDRIVRARLA